MKKIHRFHYPADYRQGDVLSITDHDVSKQISRVLKLRIGEEIVLFDGKGTEAIASINSLRPHLTVDIVSVCENSCDPRIRISLYASLLKKDNFEWLVQKATELGVAKIIPVVSDRTVKLNLNHERMNKIAAEAAELAGRGVIPAVEEPVTMANAISHAKENDVNIACDIMGRDLMDIRFDKNIRSVGIFVGPEGGFTQAELKDFDDHGFIMFKLGGTTLRGETAGMVAVYTLASYFG